MKIIALLVCLMGLEVKADLPTFTSVKTRNNTEETGTIYADVFNHSKKPYTKSSRSTNVHETVHFINGEMQRKHFKDTNINAFYALDGKVVIVKEPNIKKSDVKKFIPKGLRSYRYNLYIAGQKEWEKIPTYLVDEFSAYVIGGMCCVQDINNDKFKEADNDGVSGCLDFSIYVTALCMAIQEGDPEYWENEPQLKNYINYMMLIAQKTFLEGRNLKQLKSSKQEKLLTKLLTSKEGKPMRDFLRKEFNSAWLDITP